MTSVPELFSIQTPHPADSLSVLPGDPSRPTVLACGTYRLIEETPQRRIGTVTLYEAGTSSLTELSTCDGAGILDLQWAIRDDESPVLLTADAEGNLNVYDCNQSDSHLSLASTASCSSSALALSLSLQGSYHSVPHLGPVLVSLSNGEIAHVVHRDGQVAVESAWQAHAHEVWFVSWGHEPGIAYSGSDDLTLKGWDLRAGTDSPTFVTRRFEGGITSIVPSPWDPNHITVGSYDSLVRIFDVRAPQRALQTHIVAGGAWRLAYHPSAERKNQLLVAAMHGGAEIVHLDTGDDAATNSTTFEGHESMCYGAQWLTTDMGEREDIVASCSFYDQKLCLWKA